MKNFCLFLFFLAVLACLVHIPVFAGSEPAPTGSNINKNSVKITPVQDSQSIYTGGAASAKNLDNSLANPVVTLYTLYGAHFPTGTNKIVFRCAYAVSYGNASITSTAGVNLTTTGGTDIVFRGSQADLEGLHVCLATSTVATVATYIFPFIE